MPLAARAEHLGVDAAAVIADEDAQRPGRELDLDLDLGGLRVLEGVHQRLAADAVHLVTDQRTQGPRPAFDEDAKAGGLLEPELPWHARQGLERSSRRGSAGPACEGRARRCGPLR